MTADRDIFSKSAHLQPGEMLDYLRKSVSKEDARRIEHHLSDCELCSDALEGLQKMKADTSILNISSELRKMAGKRKLIRPKVFPLFDPIVIFAIVFLLIFLIVIALIMFRQ